MRKALVTFAVLAIAASAQGSVLLSTHTLTGTNSNQMTIKVYYETTKTVLGVDYDILSVEAAALDPATVNDYISAYDVNITPESGSYILHIRPYSDDDFGNVPAPDMAADAGGLLLDPSIDTHFNMTGWSAAETPVAETYGAPGLLGTIAGKSMFGNDQVVGGASLYGVASMLNEERANPYKFLNVVVPELGKAKLISYRDGLPEFGDGGGETWSLPEAGIDIGPVPEPATLGLLVIGVVGLLCRRRR